VSVLWITGGLMQVIPHREATPAFYAMNFGPGAQILTIFKIQPTLKLVCANVKNIFKTWKTLWLKRDS